MKFNSIGPAGYPTLAQTNHREPCDIIMNGINNNGTFTWQVNEYFTIPKELTIYLRPMQQVYRIKQDLTYEPFVNWNTSLAKFVNPTNPCCYVTKLNEFQWWLSGFDTISRSLIEDIDKTMVGLYLSKTLNIGQRECVIFKQDNPILKTDYSNLKIATGIVTWGNHLHGPAFYFNVLSNPTLYETCPSHRT